MRWKYEADKILVKRTAFDWTILRPGGLKDEAGQGKASIGKTHITETISVSTHLSLSLPHPALFSWNRSRSLVARRCSKGTRTTYRSTRRRWARYWFGGRRNSDRRGFGCCHQETRDILDWLSDYFLHTRWIEVCTISRAVAASICQEVCAKKARINFLNIPRAPVFPEILCQRGSARCHEHKSQQIPKSMERLAQVRFL